MGIFNLLTIFTAAVRDRDEAIQRHVWDSLALLPALESHMNPDMEASTQIIDVGSGAGFPGAILAIAKPDWQVRCTCLLGAQSMSGFLHCKGQQLPHAGA
jgi:16S rRNA G527 N7-methylase RsmG